MHSWKIGKSSLFLAVVFVILALPLYGTNNIGRALTMPSYYLFCLVGAFCLIENGFFKRKWSKMGVLLGLYYLTAFFGAFLGFTNGTMELAYVLWYIAPPLVIFMVNLASKKKSIYDWMDLIYYAMFVSALLTFVMIQTKESSLWEFTSYLNGKLGGSYESIFLLSVPYGIYLLTSDKKRINKVIIVLETILSVYDVIYAQSRALLVFLLIEIVAIIAIPNITKSRFEGKTKKRLFRLVALILVVFFVYGFINGESDLLFRMQTTNVLSSQDTLVGRWFTFLNNLKLAFKNPLGLGIGHPMHYY